jgi:hypothetical protein
VKNDQQLYWSEGGNEYKLSANTGSSGGNLAGEPLDLIGTDVDVWALSADQKDIYTYHNVNVRNQIIFGENVDSFVDDKRKVRLYVNDDNELYFNDGQSDVKLSENNNDQLTQLSAWDVSNDLDETTTTAKVVSKGELAMENTLVSYATGLSNVVSGSTTFTGSSNTITSPTLNIPAGSLITGIHVIVTTDLATSTTAADIGLKAGVSGNLASIVESVVDNLADNITNGALAAGCGTSTIPRTKTSLAGGTNATIVVAAGQSYRTADTGLIITVTSLQGDDSSTALNFTAGAIKFIVEYIM